METSKLMAKIKRIPLGKVIAERVLEAVRDGKSYKVIVRIGCPVEFPEGPRYLCPYQIAGT